MCTLSYFRFLQLSSGRRGYAAPARMSATLMASLRFEELSGEPNFTKIDDRIEWYAQVVYQVTTPRFTLLGFRLI